jgi:hypothetical protein
MPRLAKPQAMALPIPLDPPVTRATLPFSSFAFIFIILLTQSLSKRYYPKYGITDKLRRNIICEKQIITALFKKNNDFEKVFIKSKHNGG